MFVPPALCVHARGSGPAFLDYRSATEPAGELVRVRTLAHGLIGHLLSLCCVVQRFASHHSKVCECGVCAVAEVTAPELINCLLRAQFMLLFTPDVCRVIVTSANLIPGDFEKRTNGVWWRDFPRRRLVSSSTSATPPSSDFQLAWVTYLQHLASDASCPRASSAALRLISKYDMNAPDLPTLVASVPGTHRDGDLRR